MYKTLLAIAGALWIPAHAPAQTLCSGDESIQFSCPVGNKIVSLCGRPRQGAMSALTYRFGTAAKVENEFTATPTNGQFFSFDVAPAGPQTPVSMIWFDKGPYRYLVSECSGSFCPFSAGLAVLREDKVLMNQRCVTPKGAVRSGFTGDLVEFGSNAATSTVVTPLVRNGFEYGTDITRIYRVQQ